MFQPRPKQLPTLGFMEANNIPTGCCLLTTFPRAVVCWQHSVPMPPVALPQFSEGLRRSVRVPRAPANPPTSKDVAEALRLTHEVRNARRQFYHLPAKAKCSWMPLFRWRFGNWWWTHWCLEVSNSIVGIRWRYVPWSILVLSWVDVPCCPGGEPAWFDAAMVRVLAPIHQNLAQLGERVDQLSERVNQLDQRVAQLNERMQAVEVSNKWMCRLAAIVESFIPFYSFLFSLKKCRALTVLADQLKINSWRLFFLLQGKIPEKRQYVLLILVYNGAGCVKKNSLSTLYHLFPQ